MIGLCASWKARELTSSRARLQLTAQRFIRRLFSLLPAFVLPGPDLQITRDDLVQVRLLRLLASTTRRRRLTHSAFLRPDSIR